MLLEAALLGKDAFVFRMGCCCSSLFDAAL
jgi:hypothetical protein